MELNGKVNLQGYLIHGITEDWDVPGDLPSQPVEDGMDLTDHVIVGATTLSLTGILTRPTPERVQVLIDRLESWKAAGTRLQYEGSKIVQNVAIKDFKYSKDAKIRNGYNFSMTLQQIRVGKPSYVKTTAPAATKPVTNSGQKQPANANTKEKYHIVKKGDTYWALAKKYGSTVKQLRDWNKYPDRKIPIKAKLRVA
ncbi:LysM peptidoglycan-binding domain-containing protein [Domibacillus iocasae]|uniref:LysM domain-containing protein n=1 Tax=Domibacillus iocasae TaxID=1714016 RepID=A0A1E7DQ59_9BACI|nr:LysM peptidoglycan-binding domain-containing protein [Domibacillus iocasae]OES45226.1 hypothetical protein BA724_04250 [Domibacillus iocasae]